MDLMEFSLGCVGMCVLGWGATACLGLLYLTEGMESLEVDGVERSNAKMVPILQSLKGSGVSIISIMI
jgi:hypothetical protein